MLEAEGFYDALAGDYHLLFADWWPAARWHGEVIAGVLAARGLTPPATVLDCTCGIGTQALPLAAVGYRVVATDVSAEAVRRARVEAAARGLTLDLRVADVRRLRRAVDGVFDAVISCDNALPHLLTDDDLASAARGIRDCLRDGGVLVASIQDYDALRLDHPPGTPITLHGSPGRRAGAVQSWAWSPDGEVVDVSLFLLQESANGWRVSAHETRPGTGRYAVTCWFPFCAPQASGRWTGWSPRTAVATSPSWSPRPTAPCPIAEPGVG